MVFVLLALASAHANTTMLGTSATSVPLATTTFQSANVSSASIKYFG